MKRPEPPERDERGWPVWARTAKGKPCCGAGRKSSDRPCQNTARYPNGRCKFHGGPTPKRGGVRVEALRALRLDERFEAALAEPGLLESRDNIATLEALIADALEGDHAHGRVWKDAARLYTEALGGDRDAFRALGEALKAGVSRAGRLDRAVALMDEQRKHKLAQSRHEADAATSMTMREVATLIGAIGSVLERHIPDAETRRAIADDLARTVSSRPDIAIARSRSEDA